MQVATLEQLQKVVDYSSFLESHISRLEPKGFRVRARVFWLWWWWKAGVVVDLGKLGLESMSSRRVRTQ